MARMHPILCGTVIALCACSAPPPKKSAEAGPDPIAAHQDPSNPNPAALPGGVLEWIEYACAIEDSEERAKAIDEGRNRGWAIECREKSATDAGPG